MTLRSFLIAIPALFVAFGCEPQEVTKDGRSINEVVGEPVASTSANSEKPKEEPPKETPKEEPSMKPKDGEEVAVFETGQGRIVIAFRPDKAPNHVAQYKKLISKGFYDGTRFHRCIEGFMIQGGDPNSKDLKKAQQWGTGGYVEGGKEVTVKAEFNDTHHARGIVSAARSQSPDSASSQFFICQGDAGSLDNQYSAWGYVVSGMDVVDKIVKTGDPNQDGKVRPEEAIVLKSAKIVKWPVK